MSEEQLKAFLEAVKLDAGLQEQLRAARANADTAAVVAIAKAAGFVIAEDEPEKLTQWFALSDEELESLAGGGKRDVWCSHPCNTTSPRN